MLVTKKRFENYLSNRDREIRNLRAELEQNVEYTRLLRHRLDVADKQYQRLLDFLGVEVLNTPATTVLVKRGNSGQG